MDKSICSICNNLNVTRECVDCLKTLFCEECFAQKHSGHSSRNHTSRLIRNNAIIKDRNSKSYYYESYNTPPSPNLSSDPSNLSSLEINDDHIINENGIQADVISDLHVTQNSCLHFKLSEPNKLPEKDVISNFINQSIYQNSIITDNQCILFESGDIRQFNSYQDLATALSVNGPVESFRFPIVTFIGSTSIIKSLPNILLLKDNDIKFHEGVNKTQSPLCSMLYDTKNQLLILETQYMHRVIDNYSNQQNMLTKLLLALSDVIVFSEYKRTGDFIRIHAMMETCKKQFKQLFHKIHKTHPERLAPGLIYLLMTDVPLKDDLSTSIVNATERKELFTSCTQTVFFDKNQNRENREFIMSLRKMLEYNSEFRNLHSLEDVFVCIKSCKESLLFTQDDIASDDIPNNWFSCTITCEVCRARCNKAFGHDSGHNNDSDCQSTADNEVFFCKTCVNISNGQCNLPLVLKPMSKEEGFFKNLISYPFRRGIVECDQHGIIYDKNWMVSYYQDTIISKHLHKWLGQSLISQNVYPMGQIFLDKVKEISHPVSKFVTDSTGYLSDVIKPIEWQSTQDAYNCSCCNETFTTRMLKHHCRRCGKVICSNCCHMNRTLICQKCFDDNPSRSFTEEPTGIMVMNIFRDSYNASSNFIKKSVSSFNRPDYWEDDEKAIRCFICEKEFHCEINPIHHCRACGKCVCDRCSPEKRTVEWRCIFEPSRICQTCLANQYWRKTN